MNRKLNLLIATLAIFAAFSFPANAQKGAGDSTGVAGMAVKPAVITLSGTVLEIKTGPCEATTGRSVAGTHLIVRENARVLNIHLGPEKAVDHVVEQLAVGSPVTFELFRTEKMAEDAYIAKSLTLEGKVIHLRDGSLRPAWAYGRGSGQGRGQQRQGVRGQYGPCW